jgi:DNA-binding transcriptional LysR family regulator
MSLFDPPLSPRAMMSDRLPSLQALRCFAAAARHMSFTRASEELNVSQGVVSHHIKKLEQELGVALFNRMTRKIALTEEGRLLQPAVAEGFAGIARAVARIRSRAGEGTLTETWVSPLLTATDVGPHSHPSTFSPFGWHPFAVRA